MSQHFYYMYIFVNTFFLKKISGHIYSLFYLVDNKLNKFFNFKFFLKSYKIC